MGAREELRLLNQRGHAPKLGSTEFSGAGVTSGWVLAWDQTTEAFHPVAPGGIGTPGAPNNASYITLSSDPSLTAERVAHEGTGIQLVDGGTSAGATFRVVANDGDGIAWQRGDGAAGITANISVTGQATGSLIVRGSGQWQNLAYGAAGQFLKTRGPGLTPIWDSVPGGGGGAPATAQYVTLAVDGALSAERVLTPGAGLTLVDGGAEAAVTLGLWFSSEAYGDVAYRGPSAWTRLGAGTSGNVLTTKGVGAAPAWEPSSGGGGGTGKEEYVLCGGAAWIDAVSGVVAENQHGLDPTVFPAGSTFWFFATGSVNDASATAYCSLYNVTDGELVAGSTLTFTSTSDVRLDSSVLTTGSGTGQLKLALKTYEARMFVSGTGSTTIATIGSWGFRVQ